MKKLWYSFWDTVDCWIEKGTKVCLVLIALVQFVGFVMIPIWLVYDIWTNNTSIEEVRP